MPPKPTLAIPLKDSTFSTIKRGVQASIADTQKLLPTWQRNVSETFGDLPKSFRDEDVLVNKAFSRVKQKQASLVFRVPEVQLKPRRPGAEQGAALASAALNQKLTKDMNVGALVDDVLTDVLVPSGIGVSRIGYEVQTTTAKVKPAHHLETPDDIFAALVEQGIEQWQEIQIPIDEKYIWERIDPSAFLYPSNHDSSDWDKAPWLGYRFTITKAECKRLYRLTDEQVKALKTSGPQDSLADDDSATKHLQNVTGHEIWYRPFFFDDSVPFRDQVRKLVYFEGLEEAVVHEDAPYQWISEDGRLQGVSRLPIRVLALTRRPGKPIPPSDVSMARPQQIELSKGRTIEMLNRERSIPVRWFDVNQVDETTEQMLYDGRVQQWLPFNGDARTAIGEVARATFPPENMAFDRKVEREIDEMWSLPNAAQISGETSAAAAKEIGGMAGNRLDYERTKVLKWFAEGAEIVFGLMQRFADTADYVELVGPDGARKLVEWSKANIQGQYAFDVRPDSSLHIDAGQDRAQALNLFQLLANDPMVDRRKLVAEVLRTHNLDETQILLQQPPQPQPEPPNISMRVSDDCLDPTKPSSVAMYEILRQRGIEIPQEIIEQSRRLAEHTLSLAAGNPALALADTMRVDLRGNLPPASTPPVNLPPHPGAVSPAAPLSKSQLDEGRVK